VTTAPEADDEELDEELDVEELDDVSLPVVPELLPPDEELHAANSNPQPAVATTTVKARMSCSPSAFQDQREW
jgi:hypothetical protein